MDELSNCRKWLRFLTGNSAKKEEIFDCISPEYRTSVRYKIAEEIATYMQYLDALEEHLEALEKEPPK